MHRFPLFKYLFALPAALSIGLLLPAQAEAVDPTTSDFVTDYNVRPTTAFFDIIDDDQVYVMGKDECIRAFESTPPTELRFDFSLTTEGGNLFDNAYVFAVPTDNTPQDFECDTELGTDNCTNIENVDEFVEPQDPIGYSRTIDFDELVQEAVDQQTGNNNIELVENADDCRDLDVDQRYFIRLFFEGNAGAGQIEDEHDVVIELDLKPPAMPVSSNVDAVTENTIFLQWTQEETEDLNLGLEQDDIRETLLRPFAIFYSNQNINGWSLEELQASEDVEFEVIELDNPNADGPEFSGKASISEANTEEEDRVWVALVARDDVGNLSDPLYPAEQGEEGLAPVPVIDFWENYKESGGGETGGCNTSGGPLSGSTVLLGLLGLGIFGWRRRRRLRQAAPVIAAVGAFGLTVAAAPDAHAQSPTWGLAEIRIGGYYPSIDDEEGLQGEPFREIFGGGSRVLVEYEQGIHVYDGFGAFGASGSVGYTHFGGQVLVEEGSPIEAEDLDEETGMMVIPLRAGLYYQIDQFQEYWSIPVVPIVKGGVDYFLWQIEEPSGDTADFEGEEGDGGTWGWHVAAGLQLGLDWIDPSASAAMDYSWGINHTYAFVEYQISQVDDFGASDSFDLSDDRWVFGLAFEY